MADLYRNGLIDIDLNKSLVRSYAGELLATGDKLSNRYGVRVFRQGAAVNLSGYAVTGYFIRPDMETVVITGAVSGNVAYVDLPQACYTQQGQFTLAVKVSGGGITQTVRIVDGYIRTTQTGTLIDPGSVIPTLDELFAQIAAVEQATAEATTATQEAKQATADTKAATQEIMTTSAPAIVHTVTGALVNVTDGASRPAVRVVTHIEPVQDGSGEASPSNVRPIKGLDSISVWKTGKNLVPDKYVAGHALGISEGKITAYTSAGRCYVWDILLPPGTYTVSGPTNVPVYAYDPDSRIVDMTISKNNGIALPYTFTLSKWAFFALHCETAYQDAYQLEIGNSATVFDAYQGEVLRADFPETIFGGDMDWIAGKLYRSYHKITFDGVTVGAKVDTTDPGMTTYAYIQSWNMSKPLKSGSKAYPDKIKSASTNSVIAFTLPQELTGVTSADNVTTVVSKYNAVLKQWYDAGSPLEIVYEVATPDEIQLTPQEIDTLKGVNNVWSSTGDTELSYVADTKMYIDQRIAALLNA